MTTTSPTPTPTRWIVGWTNSDGEFVWHFFKTLDAANAKCEHLAEAGIRFETAH